MAKIWICDRCKCQMKDTDINRLNFTSIDHDENIEMDLCPECRNLIQDIIINSYKYDIKDKTAGDPLKDYCNNIKYPDTYDACIHFVDKRKEI